MPPELQQAVDAHYKNLYRFALSLTRSSDDAWDLTQEAFLRLARKRASIRSAKAVKSWLYTTLYREFLRVAKRGSRQDSLEEREFEESDPGTSYKQIRSAEANDVMEALMTLKSGYRQVVSLYFLESYTYKEIAIILDIPIGTVMSRLSRGKESLRAALNQSASNNNIVGFKPNYRMPSNG